MALEGAGISNSIRLLAQACGVILHRRMEPRASLPVALEESRVCKTARVFDRLYQTLIVSYRKPMWK